MAKREIDPDACPATGQVGRHVASCYTIVRNCGKHEHQHSDRGCYKRTGELKCTSAEHTHDNSCNKASGPNCGGVA
jgi:hypothetical protein